MKSLRKLFALFISVCFAVSLAACSMPMNGADGGYMGEPYDIIDGDGGYFAELGKVSDGEIAGEHYGSETDKYDSSTGYSPETTSGLITAAAWNDNIYYSFWQSLFEKGETDEENGKFYNFYLNNRWGFNSTERVKVTVKHGEDPVCGAFVECTDGDGIRRFLAKTGADGVCYLFPEIKEGFLKVTSGENVVETAFGEENGDILVQLEDAEAKRNVIKLMLVIDVTGSMGDELHYLQTELENVINRVAAADNQTRIDLALLFYRDDGDVEKFACYDFVNVTEPEGLSVQVRNLKAQRAEGGGDYPEAVDEALEMAVNKEWGEDTSTKIIFHLLDAPPHSNGNNPQNNYEQRFEAAVRKAAGKGIRICPIICSGADLLCEYLMRQTAIYTGGTFVFITDHSGIGNPHHDPEIPNIVVEKLNDLIVRLVNGYHTGTFEAPVSWNADYQTP
ncbi:MAG: VWA domain-containing protein [Clostridia bacterium]|nr:VWA domain-containing protein [Clostridia bacterium]